MSHGQIVDIVYLTIAEPNGSISLSIESVLGDMTVPSTKANTNKKKNWSNVFSFVDLCSRKSSFPQCLHSGSKRRNCAKRALGTSSRASGPFGGMGTVWGQTAEKRSALRTVFHVDGVMGGINLSFAITDEEQLVSRLISVAVNVIVVVFEGFEVTIVVTITATLCLSFRFMVFSLRLNLNFYSSMDKEDESC
ncbi:hypothetical protein GQX74_009113 [Glossina fuscipes]|nr:hypothetical protein GQX74_009113 [Glossina fuscipes]